MANIEYNSVSLLLLSAVFSCINSVMVFLHMIWNTIRYGPRKYFCVKPRDRRPSCLDDPSLGTHGFIRCPNQNLRIHYVASGHEGRPLMLFLHGFPEFWYSWRHQIKEFSKDYRTVAIDMRGYGESDKPIGITEYHISKLTYDVKEVIESLGYKSCTLVSHDWGGAVAWHFGLRYPEMVDQLITCNIPHPKAMEKHLSSSRSQQAKSWYIFFFQLPRLPEIYLRGLDLAFIKQAFTGKNMGTKRGCFSDEDIEAFKYTFAPPGALTGPVNYYRAVTRYKTPRYQSMRITSFPVLMVWGTKDGALEKEMAKMSGDYVEDYTLHFLEGVSHWVQQEEPEKVNKIIREFLQMKKTN